MSAAVEAADWPPAPEHKRASDWVQWIDTVAIFRDLGLHCTEFGDGSTEFWMEQATFTPNHNGVVPTPIVTAAADEVLGALTMWLSGPGLLPATSSLHIQFHAPALSPLTFRASAIDGTERTMFLQIVVEDRDGNRCATSQAMMIAGGSNRAS